VLAGLAEAHLTLGEPTEAVATAREGIDLGSAGGCLYNEAFAQVALAAALLATACVVPRAEIESALERAEHLVASIVQFFFSETKSARQVSRLWLWGSRFENPVVDV